MILFLDIDGVMVHANPHKIVDLEDDGFYKFSINAINALNSFDLTDFKVVLSSSHRFRFSVVEWKRIFQRRGINFNEISIIDYSLELRYSRKEEVENWIIEHGINPEDMLIIDDDKSLNGLREEYKRRLVLTNSYTGLTSSDEIDDVLKIK